MQPLPAGQSPIMQYVLVYGDSGSGLEIVHRTMERNQSHGQAASKQMKAVPQSICGTPFDALSLYVYIYIYIPLLVFLSLSLPLYFLLSDSLLLPRSFYPSLSMVLLCPMFVSLCHSNLSFVLRCSSFTSSCIPPIIVLRKQLDHVSYKHFPALPYPPRIEIIRCGLGQPVQQHLSAPVLMGTGSVSGSPCRSPHFLVLIWFS